MSQPKFQSGDRVRHVHEPDGPAGTVRAVYRRDIKTLDGAYEAFSYRVEWPSGVGEPLDETALEAA